MDNNENQFHNLEMEEHIKVPLNRIGVVIGKNGKNKLLIEEKTETTLDIDSENGTIAIKPLKTISDPLSVWIARDIVKAIARGFSEEKALKLLDSDYYLEIITLEQEKNRLKQIRGRIIGEGGKTRKIIEMSTESHLSIQGKTVSIIGLIEELPIAKKAIEMIINGQKHTTVYKLLENHRTDKKRERTELWQKKIEFKEN